MLLSFLLAVFLAIFSFSWADLSHWPEQIHLQLTNRTDEAVVVWMTKWCIEPVFASYSTTSDTYLLHKVPAKQRTFQVGGIYACVNYATLSGLSPNSYFWFQVFTGDVYKSKVIRGKASPSDFASLTCAVIADVGTDWFAAQSLSAMQEDSTLDMVLVAGDISYADTRAARNREGLKYRMGIWDKFGRMVESLASHVPIMTTIGNHEVYNEVNKKPINYLNRYRPVSMDRWYSFTAGFATFISLDIIAVIDDGSGSEDMAKLQLQWLDSELLKAVKDRNSRPWIILITHVPFYSSGKYGSRSENFDYWSKYRIRLEPYLAKYKVDLVLSGDDHIYERTYPLLESVPEISAGSVFVDPQRPVFVVTGNVARPTWGEWNRRPGWSAYRTENEPSSQSELVGYLRLTIDKSQLLLAYIGSERKTALDRAVIKKAVDRLHLHRHTILPRGSSNWKYKYQSLGSENASTVHWNETWISVKTPSGYGFPQIARYQGTEVHKSHSYLYYHEFYLPCIMREAKNFLAFLTSVDGALVVVNGNVVFDNYGIRQKWRPEKRGYWQHKYIEIPAFALRYGATNRVAANIFLERLARAHVWDMEIEALIPADKTDILYSAKSQADQKCHKKQESLVDVQYEHSSIEDRLKNPERGFCFSTQIDANNFLYFDANHLLAVKSQRNLSLVHRRYILSSFELRSLTPRFLSALQKDLTAVSLAGMKIILRFAYCTANPCMKVPLPRILRHIKQLRPVLALNSHVIYSFQAGFLGPLGDWSTLQYKKSEIEELLTSLLNTIPNKMLQLPIRKMPVLPLNSSILSHRIGFYSDNFLVYDSWVISSSGEEMPIEPSTYQQMMYSVMGGKLVLRGSGFNGLHCQKLVGDLEFLHFSYLDVSQKEISQIAQCSSVITAKLGYSIALVKGRFSSKAHQRGVVEVELTLKNSGFSAPVNPRLVQLIIKKGKFQCSASLQVDPRLWLGQGRHHLINASVSLPRERIDPGNYELFLSLPDPERRLTKRPEYNILFNNKNVPLLDLRINKLNHSVEILNTTAETTQTSRNSTNSYFICSRDKKGNI